MSSTTKTNNMLNEKRQIILMYEYPTYYPPKSVFKVPKGKDINDAHDTCITESNTIHIYWTKEDYDNKICEIIVGKIPSYVCVCSTKCICMCDYDYEIDCKLVETDIVEMYVDEDIFKDKKTFRSM
jgi:hypothetical protein